MPKRTRMRIDRATAYRRSEELRGDLTQALGRADVAHRALSSRRRSEGVERVRPQQICGRCYPPMGVSSTPHCQLTLSGAARAKPFVS
jgi:hypothetical protein